VCNPTSTNDSEHCSTSCLQRAHVTPFFISLHWLPLASRIKLKALTLAYRSTTCSAPSKSIRSYESTSLQKPTMVNERRLLVPSQRDTKSLFRTFSFIVPCWWNDLPAFIQNTESLTTFKRQLKTPHFHEHLTSLFF